LNLNNKKEKALSIKMFLRAIKSTNIRSIYTGLPVQQVLKKRNFSFSTKFLVSQKEDIDFQRKQLETLQRKINSLQHELQTKKLEDVEKLKKEEDYSRKVEPTHVTDEVRQSPRVASTPTSGRRPSGWSRGAARFSRVESATARQGSGDEDPVRHVDYENFKYFGLGAIISLGYILINYTF
jgi:hypothetical protein